MTSSDRFPVQNSNRFINHHDCIYFHPAINYRAPQCDLLQLCEVALRKQEQQQQEESFTLLFFVVIKSSLAFAPPLQTVT